MMTVAQHLQAFPPSPKRKPGGFKDTHGYRGSGQPHRPRGGKFLWRQFKATAEAGNRAASIAMSDEIDEGTAIFNCRSGSPVSAPEFQTFWG